MRCWRPNDLKPDAGLTYREPDFLECRPLPNGNHLIFPPGPMSGVESEVSDAKRSDHWWRWIYRAEPGACLAGGATGRPSDHHRRDDLRSECTKPGSPDRAQGDPVCQRRYQRHSARSTAIRREQVQPGSPPGRRVPRRPVDRRPGGFPEHQRARHIQLAQGFARLLAHV